MEMKEKEIEKILNENDFLKNEAFVLRKMYAKKNSG